MAHEIETPRERSWREVRQSVNPRAMTSQGRRRLGFSLLRTATLFLVVGGLTAAGVYWYLWYGFKEPVRTLAPVVKAEPLRDIVVLTDGVLTREWVEAQLALPQDIALVAIDLTEVKTRLEAAGQVRHAVASLEFPGTLVVTLEERVPVVRVMVPLDPKKPEALLVAPDGVVYRGFNYDRAMLEHLPWLDGIRLTRHGTGFAPIPGMDRVSELLLAGQHEAPHLAATWQVISLAEDPRIIVRTPEVREVVFEAGNYRRQFARLDYILDLYRRQNAQPGVLARVDVSLAAQVVVQPAAGMQANAIFSAFPNPTHTRTNRVIQR